MEKPKIHELFSDQMEEVLELALHPLYENPTRGIRKLYPDTEDSETDDFLEMLINWLSSLAFAIELVDGRDVDLKNLTKNSEQSNYLEKGPAPHKMVYGAAAVYKLRDILVDLRRCERNTIIDRALETNSNGRPKDNHRYAALKDEASRYYTYLRNRDVSSENACEIINSALAYWSLPQMSPDSIRKRSYSVKGSLGALLNKEDFYEKQERPKDMTDEQEFGLYSALAILSLMHYAQEAHFALGIQCEGTNKILSD